MNETPENTLQSQNRAGTKSDNHWLTSLPPSFSNPHKKHRKAMITGIDLGKEEVDLLVQELELLLGNLDVQVTGVSIQKRSAPDVSFLIGSGKAKDIGILCQASEVDLLVCNDMLTPIQLRNLRNATGCEVWDRAMVIMKIFEQRAHTAEAKLQVDLARCRYEIPHIRGLGKQMSNTGAGIGTRGPGETEFEIHRRKLERRIKEATSKLKAMQKRREGQRKQRDKSGIKTVSLAGYTNSGKTTLLKTLSKDPSLQAEDKLFATLDTSVRKISPQEGTPFLLADTVGFIRRLPPSLVAAFKTTLEEVCRSNLVLLVLDVNDPFIMETFNVIRETLAEIDAAHIPQMVILNKIDKAPKELVERYSVLLSEFAPTVAISAIEKTGIDSLLSQIEKHL